MSDDVEFIETPAPDVDMSLPIYNTTAESMVQPKAGCDYCDGSDKDVEWDDPVQLRLDAMDIKLAALTEGVNTIGAMMNEVASTFATLMQKLQRDGIGGLLGGMMGGKNNG
jgi:hypothetical protein